MPFRDFGFDVTVFAAGRKRFLKWREPDKEYKSCEVARYLIHKNLIERKTVGFNSEIARLTQAGMDSILSRDEIDHLYGGARESRFDNQSRV
jgi:hypothetical protein